MTIAQERATVTSADPVAAWLDAHTVTGDGEQVRKDELLAAYNAMAALAGRPPITARAMGEAVKQFRPGIRDKQIRAAGGKAWVWVGLRLREFGEEPAQSGQIISRQIESNGNNNVAEVVRIPLALIDPNPWQPRSHFDPQELEELAATIRAHGVLQPILVRPCPKGARDRFQLIHGERRHRASAIAGLEVIPALVRTDLDDRAVAEIALVENLQRADLSPLDTARAYQGLRDLGYTQAQIAEKVGLSQPSVANALRLLKLPEDARALIERGPLTPSHGLAILRFDGFPAVMSAVAERAAKSNTPSQDLERGFPYGYELQQAGIIRGVDSYYAPFDIAICKRCPFNAYRSAGSNASSGYCLKPEHWQELADAAIAERKAQATALTAAAREGAPEAVQAKIEQALDRARAEDGAEAEEQVLDLSKLPWNAYERLTSDNRPAGCTDNCPCFVVAMERGRLVKACLQPDRLKRLKEAVTRAAKKDLKSHFDGLLAQVRQDPPSEREQVERRRRALAQIVWQVVMTARVAIRRAAVAGYADPDLVRVLSEEHTYSAAANEAPEAWPILARQRPEDLVDLAAEILIREEHRDRLEYKHRETPRTDWYLTGAALPQAPEQPALAEGGRGLGSHDPAEMVIGPLSPEERAAFGHLVPATAIMLGPEDLAQPIDEERSEVPDHCTACGAEVPGAIWGEFRRLVASVGEPPFYVGNPSWHLRARGEVVCPGCAAGPPFSGPESPAAAAEIGPDPEPATWLACNDRRQPIVGSIILWLEAADGDMPQRARRGRVTEFEGCPEGARAEMRLHVTGDGWSTVIPASVAGLRIMPMVERD